MGPGQPGMIKFVHSRLELPFIPVGINYTADGRRTRVRIKFGKAYIAEKNQDAASLVDCMMAAIAELSGLTIH